MFLWKIYDFMLPLPLSDEGKKTPTPQRKVAYNFTQNKNVVTKN